MKALKTYFRNRRTIYFYFNRCVRNPHVRHMLYVVVRSVMPKATIAPTADDDIERLQRDGLVIWEQLLDAKTVDVIREYLLAKPVYNWVDADFNGKERTPLNLGDITITKQTKFKYFDIDIAQCKDIVTLANSPRILSLVSEYLGCKPTISLMSAWWTKTAAGSKPADTAYDDSFHRDVADYKFLKLFIYLTDVTANNGAHCFIKGSHLSGKCTERRVFSEDEINQTFDNNNQIVLTGKSGCGFLEDTWGMHRSIPCVTGERLVLHVLYNLAAFDASSPDKPLVKNIYNVDAYVNRVYLY